MKIVEIQAEDMSKETGTIEVYLMGEHSICSDQEPFYVSEYKTLFKARKAALDRAHELAKEHDCNVSWNW